MFERLSHGWELAKTSYACLKKDTELLLFPLISGVACLLVLASFAVPLMGSDYLEVVTEEGLPQDPLAYLLLFLFYFANYFIIVFFNSALITCAIIRFKGEDPTLGDGFRAAFARLPQIFGWALVSATVGLILRVIESRSERVGEIVAGLLGMAWSATTYFVIPVLVVEKVGPVDAFKRSFSILRKTWGESLVANFSIGLAVFIAVLLALVPAGLGATIGGTATIVGVAVSALLVVTILLVSSALQAILLGALYLYATEGKTPSEFGVTELEGAFAPR